MNAFRKQCIDLRNKDYTLPEIVRITGRSKASVFYHIQHIPLSRTKQASISTASGKRIGAYSSARKGKSTKGFIPFTKWSDEHVSLIAHLLFDGEIKKSGCIYTNRSGVLLAQVESLMSVVYGYKPTKYFDVHTGVSKIAYFNVALSIYLKRKASALLKGIKTFPSERKRIFLKAFFDDEGCIDFKPRRNQRRVRGYQKNISILQLVQHLLKNFGIDSKLHLPNEVAISGRANLLRFQKEINFSSGVYMNGKRSNSVWKKDMEKRHLLSMALASFQKK